MPETEQSISTGELSRAVALIRGDISTMAAALATRPDKEDLRRAEDHMVQRLQAAQDLQDLKNTLQDKAITALEGWQTWALRLGVPAVGGSLLGVAMNAIKLNGGA
ncbi:MAG: hypothetical protein M3540_07065 [Actinomycetota bacterium]|nr:hypothetical protein [Actinomycetota bacterium]